MRGVSDAIDYDGPVPVYRQLAAIIQAGIADGTYPPGRAIPSKRTLKEEYGIAGPTVDKAVALLKEAGLVEPVTGKGLFVVQR